MKHDCLNKLKIQQAILESKLDAKFLRIDTKLKKLDPHSTPKNKTHKAHKDFILKKETGDIKIVLTNSDNSTPRSNKGGETVKVLSGSYKGLNQSLDNTYWQNSSAIKDRVYDKEMKRFQRIKVDVKRRSRGRNSIEPQPRHRGMESLDVKYEPILAFPEKHKLVPNYTRRRRKNLRPLFSSPHHLDQMHSGFSSVANM